MQQSYSYIWYILGCMLAYVSTTESSTDGILQAFLALPVKQAHAPGFNMQFFWALIALMQ